MQPQQHAGVAAARANKISMAPRHVRMFAVLIFAFVLVAFQYWREASLFTVLPERIPKPSAPTRSSKVSASTDVSQPASEISRHEIISSFYHMDNTAKRIIVTLAFGRPDTYISVLHDAWCCILLKPTLERIHEHAGASASIPKTECTKFVRLQTFPLISVEAECQFPFATTAKDVEIAYFEDASKWAVVIMDQFNYVKDLRLNATMPLIRSPDRPWTTTPIHKLSFLTELRNVEHSVEELLVYQFLIGFDHGYVYDDASTDYTKDILQTYANEGLITLGDVGTQAKQRQFATITRHRMTHLHETEYIAHIDDDIFFVLLKGKKIKQASPMFAEAAIARLNSKDNCGTMQLMSYWFGPSMNMLPQKLVTQSFLWKDPWIGKVREWRGTNQDNRLSVTRAEAIAHTFLTHQYAIKAPYRNTSPKPDYMYFNHYKFRSRSEYNERMKTVSTHGSWAWTSLAINNNKTAVDTDMWDFGHKNLDIEIDTTMLVFGPSLEWLLYAGPKHLRKFVKEERVLLQQHLDRARPLLHYILPSGFVTGVNGVQVNSRINDMAVVAVTCGLESILAVLQSTYDVWVWTNPSDISTYDTQRFATKLNEIFNIATDSHKHEKPRIKGTSIPIIFRNTPFENNYSNLQMLNQKHELLRAVQLSIAHKYGGLVLNSNVAMYRNVNTSDVNVAEFLSSYSDGYRHGVNAYITDTTANTGGELVLSVQKRRHVAVWTELELLAGVSLSASDAVRDSSHVEYKQWPKTIFQKMFLKSGNDFEMSGLKGSIALDACAKLARVGWDRLCPNTVAWVNCQN